MNTAARIVKMYACRNATRSSKPVRATSSAPGAIGADLGGVEQRRGQHAEAHQDEVAGEHVGEESDHQGEGPDEAGRR